MLDGIRVYHVACRFDVLLFAVIRQLPGCSFQSGSFKASAFVFASILKSNA